MNPMWSLGSPAFTFVILSHMVFQQHLNMHICLSNKNEDSLYIFRTDVQNKLPYLGTLFTLSDLLLEWPDFALCLHTGLQMRGVREIIMVLLLWQTPVPYQCACPFPLKRESLLCFVSDIEMAVRCCCFSTAFHIATATWLVLWSQNSPRGHIEPVTALSVLVFSDLRMLSSPGSLHNETLGVREVCLQNEIRSMFDRWGDAASGELGMCRSAAWDPCVFASGKLQSFRGF